jgi:hypothetical protein
MKEYEKFDYYLQNSKKIREFCNDREKMIFEILRMDLYEEGKIHWLESVGLEIDRVLSFIGRLENERKSHLNLRK